MLELLRGKLFHTPKNPFEHSDALEVFEDGGLLFEDGRIIEIGDYSKLKASYPDAQLLDYRNSFILPGFVDCHVHYPQIPVLGAMGLRLLEWLDTRTLPEEAKFSDATYAKQQANSFLKQLARNGTTTALVFGAHFKDAMHAFFEEADASSLRITSGLVLGDRLLKDELHISPQQAYDDNKER